MGWSISQRGLFAFKEFGLLQADALKILATGKAKLEKVDFGLIYNKSL